MRAIFGTIGLLCNYYAIGKLELADANMLNKMAPFSALLFSALFLKEKVKPVQLLMVGVAFAGSILIIKPSPANMMLVPALVGFIGGLGAGAGNASVRGATKAGCSVSYSIFAFSLFSTLLIAPLVLLDYVRPTALQLVYLLCCGLCAAAAQFSITTAYSKAPAREISVFDFFQVIISAAWGFFLFDQRPDIFSVLGYCVIIAAGVGNYAYTLRSHRISAAAAE